MDFKDAPAIIKDFLTYHETIRGHSRLTVDEYYLDLRNFFRFIKQLRGYAPDNARLESISISDVDLDFVRRVNLAEVYEYLNYLSRERETENQSPAGKRRGGGLKAATRARKIATIRSFYKYLMLKVKLIDENPLLGLDSPKIPKALPRYLSLEESKRLLSSVNTRNKERDYCILVLFLNCGLRISEIVNLDLHCVSKDHLRIHGKGNKERIVFLSDASRDALDSYLVVRDKIKAIDKAALFLSNRRTRLSRETVHKMVKGCLLAAGLDSAQLSSHKLRHTAATLMLKNGVDVRTLQEILGHEHLNTTQIYTHVDNAELKMAAKANPLGTFTPENGDS